MNYTSLEISQKSTEALKWILEILNRRGVDYQIAGGLAGKIFGSQRDLNDIDIDIPDTCLNEILSDVADYVSYGPHRYKDDKWDLELMTLNYKGQEIDISGGDTVLISNKERTKWIPMTTDFSKALDFTINGISVKVIDPKNYIEYKKELDGDHHIVDIQAAEKFLSLKSNH